MFLFLLNLVPRGRDPFGQRRGSGPTRSPLVGTTGIIYEVPTSPLPLSAGQSNADSGNEIGSFHSRPQSPSFLGQVVGKIENHKLSRVALGTRMGSFQPRSQSSSAISDVTSLLPSPVKLVGEIRYRARFQASSGHSDSANRPGYEAEFLLKSVDLNVDLWF